MGLQSRSTTVSAPGQNSCMARTAAAGGSAMKVSTCFMSCSKSTSGKPRWRCFTS